MNLLFRYVETFERRANVAFRDARERDICMQQAEIELLAHPEKGDLMPRCGGARKLRLALPGRGKRGGGARSTSTFQRVSESISCCSTPTAICRR